VSSRCAQRRRPLKSARRNVVYIPCCAVLTAMALIYPNMPCSICREPLREGDDIVATTHFIGDLTDPLWRFSDSAMHRSCFDRWEHRDEFTRRYRQTMGGLYPDSAYARWPGPSGQYVIKAKTLLPSLPKALPFACPACGQGLTRSQRDECPKCTWLKFPSDRTRWGREGCCPHCGFDYRWDGTRCSHCGHAADKAAESDASPM
jgi:hypothetical protein